MNARCLSGPVLGLALAATPSTVCARDKAPVEVGFSVASVSVWTSEGSDSTWMLAAPANGASFAFAEPGLHACVGLGEKLSFEPQVGLVHFGGGSGSYTMLSLRGQLNVSLRPWQSKTAYFFGHAGMLVTTGDDSDSQGYFGFGIGYRAPIREHAVLRWEAFYNRFPSSDSDTYPNMNQLGARMKLGILF